VAHVVAVAVPEDAPVFDLAVPCEVFGIARTDLVDPWYDLRLCVPRPGLTTTARGLIVNTRHDLSGLLAADTVIVLAGPETTEAPPADLVETVQAAHARGARIVSICGGAFVLAAAGLLDGRRATCHWMGVERLAARYLKVEVDPSVLYVDNGDVLTSAGTAAGIDLCLHLVRLDHGARVAAEVARRMVVPPHRAGGQAQYVRTPMPAPDRALSPMLDWALARLHQPLTVRDLARHACMNERTFERSFHAATGTSPLRWLLAQRLRLAQELLETTDEPIDKVAECSGLGSAANLRQHFARSLGVSPTAYRATFRG
jgi:AraC family transcriptional activator FtrA